MIARKVSDIQGMINPHGVEARPLFQSDRAMIMHLTLKSGDSITPHPSPAGTCFFVLEGEGTVIIGDEKKDVQAGTVIECPAGHAHGWLKESPGTLKILVFKLS